MEFLTQPALQLEKFSEVKRGKIIEKYGDMRVLMGYQILSVWSKLGKKIIVTGKEPMILDTVNSRMTSLMQLSALRRYLSMNFSFTRRT